MSLLNPSKSSVRDFFLYILMGGVFYFLMFDVVSLMFSYINQWLPDATQDYYYSFTDTIRTELASLIVLFPVYVGVAWFLRKDLNKNTDKLEFPLRKFFVYLTLFLVAIALIADLISLINYYLDGELTLRFGMKILTVLVVALSVGAYFWYELKRDAKNPPSKLIAGVASAVFLAIVITGLVLAGSPGERRSEKIDEQHLANIQSITYAVNEYWNTNTKLPASMEELSKKSMNPIPQNTVTKKSYEYVIINQKQYKLCADFMLKSEDNEITSTSQYKPYPGYMYDHPAGAYCFTFEMKDRYPNDNQTYIESVPVL